MKLSELNKDNYQPYIEELKARAEQPSLKEEHLRMLIALEDPRITRTILTEQESVPEDILLEIAHTDLPRLFRPLARRNDLSKEIIEILIGKGDGVVTATLIEDNKVSLEQLKEILSRKEDIFTLRAALNWEGLPKKMIEDIWLRYSQEYTSLRQVFAKNKNTPSYILESLSFANDINHETALYLVSNPNSTWKVFHNLSTQDLYIRSIAAESVNTPKDVLINLAQDKEPYVASKALWNIRENRGKHFELTEDEEEELILAEKLMMSARASQKFDNIDFRYDTGSAIRGKANSDLELLKRLKGYLSNER